MLVSPGPYDRGGHDGDDGKPLGSQLAHLLVRHPLRLLVDRAEAAAVTHGLIGNLAGGVRSECDAARAIDDARHARFRCGAHDVLRPFDVDLEHAHPVGDAELVERREVEDGVRSTHRTGEARRLGHVSGDDRHPELSKGRGTLRRARESRHLPAALDEAPGDVTADESGCSSDECAHER